LKFLFIVVQNIYVIKQDIRIYIYAAYGWPNNCSDWAEIFCGHSWVKKIEFFFQTLLKKFFLIISFIFLEKNFPRATPVWYRKFKD